MSEYIVKIGFWLRAYDGLPNTSTLRSGVKASSPLSTGSRPPAERP